VQRLGLDPVRAARRLMAYQHVLSGVPLPEPPRGVAAGVTVACCVTDRAQLEANLLASPDLGAGGPHEVLLYRGCAGAAAAINDALERSPGRAVVWAHQDVYLPRGWFARAAWQLGLAGRAAGRAPAVAGVYGVLDGGAGAAGRVGRVVDRERLLDEGVRLPAAAATLDELVLVLPPDTGLRADPALGFHLYGADLALQAAVLGRPAAVLDAPCLHNSRTTGLPAAFHASAAALAAKWPGRVPVPTSCGWVGPDGVVRPL